MTTDPAPSVEPSTTADDEESYEEFVAAARITELADARADRDMYRTRLKDVNAAWIEQSKQMQAQQDMLMRSRENSDRICNWFWHNDPAALKDDGPTDAVLKKLDAQATELAKLREQLAAREQAESWTEYGVRWLGEKPTPESSDVDVRGDSRENYTMGSRVIEAGKGSAEGAAYDYGRDGYECRVEFRVVTAGPWQHGESS